MNAMSKVKVIVTLLIVSLPLQAIGQAKNHNRASNSTEAKQSFDFARIALPTELQNGIAKLDNKPSLYQFASKHFSGRWSTIQIKLLLDNVIAKYPTDENSEIKSLQQALITLFKINLYFQISEMNVLGYMLRLHSDSYNMKFKSASIYAAYQLSKEYKSIN